MFRPAMCRRTFEAAWIKLSGLKPQGPEVMTSEAWRDDYLIRVLQDRGYVVQHESKVSLSLSRTRPFQKGLDVYAGQITPDLVEFRIGVALCGTGATADAPWCVAEIEGGYAVQGSNGGTIVRLCACDEGVVRMTRVEIKALAEQIARLPEIAG